MSKTSAAPSLAKQLFTMTWPMLFGVLSIMSFQLVDSAFIGQLGVLPLAAQGFTAPIQMLIIGLQVGLGIATTAIISRTLGAEKFRCAKQLGGLIILIGAVGVALFCILLWLLRGLILHALGAPESVFPIIDEYWPLWLLSSWIGAMLYFYYSICRANGNTMLPGSLMVITSVLNLVLDPLFIFTFDLGIQGAAIATCLAFTIGLMVIVPKVTKKQWLVYNFADISVKQSLQNIGKIMGPAMISQLLPPLSSMFATKLVASFGTAAVASWALGSRYEFFAIVAVLALTMSMPPMIGKLLGANRICDIHQLVLLGAKFILGLQLVIAFFTWLAAEPLAVLMTSETAVSDILTWHLMLTPISLGMLGVCMLLVSVNNALGKSMSALWISMLRLFACFLPCCWLGAQLGGMYGLLWGATVGNVLAGVMAWTMYRKVLAHICNATPDEGSQQASA